MSSILRLEMSTQQENSANVSGTRCLYDLLCSETPGWNAHTDKRKLSGAQKRLEKLLRQSGNDICADCGSPDPKWVSLNLGVFICIKCSGVHRSLGVHISKVFSVKLDEWSDDQVDAFGDMGGNNAANHKFEACIPDDIKKPSPDSSIMERSDFIRRKYEKQQFLNSNEQNPACPFPGPHSRSCSSSQGISSNNDKSSYDKQATRHRIGHAFRNSWGRIQYDNKSPKNCTSLKPESTNIKERICNKGCNKSSNSST